MFVNECMGPPSWNRDYSYWSQFKKFSFFCLHVFPIVLLIWGIIHESHTFNLRVLLCRLNCPFLSSIPRWSVEVLIIPWLPPNFPCDESGLLLSAMELSCWKLSSLSLPFFVSTSLFVNVETAWLSGYGSWWLEVRRSRVHVSLLLLSWSYFSIDPSSAPQSCLPMASWSASHQLGFWNLLCLVDI